MNTLEYVPVPAFTDNYIWLVSNGRDAVVVDPGEAAPVRAFLAQRRLRLSAILLTHHHADHVGGVADLCGHSSIPVYGPAAEAIAEVTHPLSGGDRVRLESPAMDLAVLDVPGHTRGHIAYFQDGRAGAAHPVFCGDTLFACGCGRLFEGTPAQMLASLDALASLPGETQVHCAHEYTLANIRFALACEPGNAELRAWQEEAAARRAREEPTLPTTIAHERAVNPFLRAQRDEIRATLAEQFHQTVPDKLTSFTLMREWKNRFR
jgi:hydroxyacylglutathione hydrolase